MHHLTQTPRDARLDEGNVRRPDFRGGRPIRLADGQEWRLPGPRELAHATGRDRDDVVATLSMIAEAEDETERLRAELALAIQLLSLNYDLIPGDYSPLLGGLAGSANLAAIQADIHDLANGLGAALVTRSPGTLVRRGPRSWFSGSRPHTSREGVIRRDNAPR